MFCLCNAGTFVDANTRAKTLGEPCVCGGGGAIFEWFAYVGSNINKGVSLVKH